MDLARNIVKTIQAAMTRATNWALVNEDGGDLVRTENQALAIAPLYQGLTVLAGDVANLPLRKYERTDEGRERLRDNADKIVNVQANDYPQTAYNLRFTMQWQAVLHGNAYAYIWRDGGGRLRGLYIMEPSRCEPVLMVNQETNERTLLYWVQVWSNSQRSLVSPYEVFHVPNLGWGHGSSDVPWGEPLLRLARQSLGLTKSAETYGHRFFANDAKPDIYFETQHEWDKLEKVKFLDAWSEFHGGSKNKGKPAFLPAKMELKETTTSNEDAQFLETRQFQRTEVASWLNLPPHKVGDLSRATFSNIEEQNRDYLNQSLMRWLRVWESEANLKLLNPEEKATGRFYFEHNTAALLRGSYQSQVAAMAVELQNGTLNADEAREALNRNTYEGGDVYRYPLNLGTVGVDDQEPIEPPPPPPPPPPTDEEQEQAEASLGLVVEALANTEARLVKRAMGRGRKPGGTWADAFYANWRDDLAEAIEPLAARAGFKVSRQLIDHCKTNRQRLADGQPLIKLELRR